MKKDNNSFDIEWNGSKYRLLLEEQSNSLKMQLKEEGTIPSVIFEENFSLQALVQKSKFFKLFDSISELIPDLVALIEEKKYSLNFETNCAMISLSLPMKLIEEVVFALPHYQSDPNTIIQDLSYVCNSLNKKVNALTKDVEKMKEYFSLLEEDTEFNSTICRMRALKADGILRDEGEKELIGNWIKPSHKIKMELLYKASQDSDQSSIFHSKCDGKSPTLTLLKTTKGYRCGGYTNQKWDTSSGYKKDSTAFIFSLDTKKMYKSSNDNSIYCNSSYGPTFGGGHDLYISNGCMTSNKTSSYCSCPSTYTGCQKSELTGGETYFGVKEVEVYLITFENKEN